MHAHKLFTVCIMPMPRDFRPDSTGNHLDVDYVSDEYFLRYRFAMDEVKRLGMKNWLYDEGGLAFRERHRAGSQKRSEPGGPDAGCGAPAARARGEARHPAGSASRIVEDENPGGVPYPAQRLPTRPPKPRGYAAIHRTDA